MLDGAMRKIIDPPLNRMGRSLAQVGVSANVVTLAGMVMGLAAAACIANRLFLVGLAFLLASRLADGLDGAVARATTKTDLGGFFDIVADFFFYGAIPLAFAVENPQANAIAAAVLLLSFHVNGSTFLGYAILAEKNAMHTRSRGEKSLYFTDGLLEGTETIAFFVALCLWPDLLPPLAYLFAAATFCTAALRVWQAHHHFSGSKRNR
ncbi:MAG TPA: CDP-alcohol phosphatidyltransferase family protein [Devosia sp.]|nr:CDP-alcohol phosphatidyltransferase family protein [Devosia sp.]